MSQYKLLFSVEEDNIISLHLGNGTVIQFENIESYIRFYRDMQSMVDEIRDNL